MVLPATVCVFNVIFPRLHFFSLSVLWAGRISAEHKRDGGAKLTTANNFFFFLIILSKYKIQLFLISYIIILFDL